MSIDAIVETPPDSGFEPSHSAGGDIGTFRIGAGTIAAETRLSAVPEAEKPYSDADLALFHELTGYRLAAFETMWIVIDDEGKRAPFADRLFAALAEEAFRFADRHRRAGALSGEKATLDNPVLDDPTLDDLTLEDLATALVPLQRIASQLGARGVSAFRRLDAALLARRRSPAATPFEALAAMSAVRFRLLPATVWREPFGLSWIVFGLEDRAP